MNPVVGAALAMGGASLASNLIGGIFGNKATSNTNASNLQIARENNQTAIDIANRNNELSYQMFLRQLEYASPSEQRRMLEEAGYNPNLYALGASAPAASAPSLQQPSLATPTMQAPLSLAQSLTQFGQSVGSLYSIAADADLKKAQSTNQKIKNDFEVGRQAAELRLIGANAEAKDLENTYNHYTMSDRILSAKMNNEVLDAEKRLKIAQSLHQEIRNKYADELNQKELKQLEKAIDLLTAQEGTEFSKQLLNKAGISDYVSQIAFREFRKKIDQYDAETRRIVGTSQARSSSAMAKYFDSISSINEWDLKHLKEKGYSRALEEVYKIRDEADLFRQKSIGQGWQNAFDDATFVNRSMIIWTAYQNALKDNDLKSAETLKTIMDSMSQITGK